MKYERLTKKCEVGIGLTETSGNIVNDYDKVVQRLAELEDKIENGTLIELPCKVDGIVYFVSKKNGIQWSGITGIQVLIDRYTKFIQVRDDGYKWHSVNNRTVFLTKAEADQKLKELEE